MQLIYTQKSSIDKSILNKVFVTVSVKIDV